MEQQAKRVWQQLQGLGTDLDRDSLLDQPGNRPEVLYFKVLSDHLTELLPAVYTPRVGEALISTAVAAAVYHAAVEDGVATKKHHGLVQAILTTMWIPEYQTGAEI